MFPAITASAAPPVFFCRRLILIFHVHNIVVVDEVEGRAEIPWKGYTLRP